MRDSRPYLLARGLEQTRLSVIPLAVSDHSGLGYEDCFCQEGKYAVVVYDMFRRS